MCVYYIRDGRKFMFVCILLAVRLRSEHKEKVAKNMIFAFRKPEKLCWCG